MKLLQAFALLGTAASFTPAKNSVNSKRPRVASPLSMAAGGSVRVRPVGIGSSAPHTTITNADLESVHDTSDEWISSRTGIRERHVLVHEGTRSVIEKSADGAVSDAEEPETLRTLGIEAAKNALEMSGKSPEDIDLVICATSSPDDLFGDAPSIASAVGCPKGTPAFDLTAACSGFLFGTVTASQFMANGGVKNALVIGADALTRWVDWDDRNSCILFGDGAGAMVLTADEEEGEGAGDGIGLLGYAMHSNGLGYNDLKCM